MAEEKNTAKIMTKPLPQILDEMEAWIKKLEENQTRFDQMMEEAGKATQAAQEAGLDAGKMAEATAQKAVDEAKKAIGVDIKSLRDDFETFKGKVESHVKADEISLITRHDNLVKGSPFFRKPETTKP